MQSTAVSTVVQSHTMPMPNHGRPRCATQQPTAHPLTQCRHQTQCFAACPVHQRNTPRRNCADTALSLSTLLQPQKRCRLRCKSGYCATCCCHKGPPQVDQSVRDAADEPPDHPAALLHLLPWRLCDRAAELDFVQAPALQLRPHVGRAARGCLHADGQQQRRRDQLTDCPVIQRRQHRCCSTSRKLLRSVRVSVFEHTAATNKGVSENEPTRCRHAAANFLAKPCSPCPAGAPCRTWQSRSQGCYQPAGE